MCYEAEVNQRDCVVCGEPFTFQNRGSGKRKIYCSGKCKFRAYRERQRAIVRAYRERQKAIAAQHQRLARRREEMKERYAPRGEES